MDYGVTLSIRRFLASYMPEVTEVVMMRDGIKLSGRVKPFLTVDYLGSEDELLAAGRESYEENYYYQVGVHANTLQELLKTQAKVKTLLRRPDGITLYSDDAIDTGKRFVVNITGFTPIKSDDTSNETENHRGYFDVNVRIFLDTGDTEFTQ